MATNWRHGFHFDEFYYVACGQRLAFGYVDHPPVTPLLARIFTELFGLSLPALRLAPALAGGLIVLLTGWIAKELGGGRFAQIFSAAAVAVSPALLSANTYFQTVTFNQLAWLLAIAVIVRILRTESRRWWVLLGLIGGLGFLTKVTFGLLVAAFGLSLLLTKQRRILATVWPWAGAATALLLFSPHLHWQIDNDWPTLGFMRHQAGVDYLFPGATSLVQFLATPTLLPLTLAGLLWFFSAEARTFRPLGATFVVVVLVCEMARAKFYYPLPLHPLLLAAGSLVAERWIKRGRSRLRRNLLAVAAALNLALVPLLVPIVPYRVLVDREIPHSPDFEAMIGWTDYRESVLDVYRELDEGDRSRVEVLTKYYGTAASLNLFAQPEGLPKAVSGHNNFYLWGPGDGAWEIVLAVDFEREELKALFAEVELARLVPDRYGVFERDRAIYVCRSPRATPAELWPKLRLNF